MELSNTQRKKLEHQELKNNSVEKLMTKVNVDKDLHPNDWASEYEARKSQALQNMKSNEVNVGSLSAFHKGLYAPPEEQFSNIKDTSPQVLTQNFDPVPVEQDSNNGSDSHSSQNFGLDSTNDGKNLPEDADSSTLNVGDTYHDSSLEKFQDSSISGSQSSKNPNNSSSHDSSTNKLTVGDTYHDSSLEKFHSICGSQLSSNSNSSSTNVENDTCDESSSFGLESKTFESQNEITIPISPLDLLRMEKSNPNQYESVITKCKEASDECQSQSNNGDSETSIIQSDSKTKPKKMSMAALFRQVKCDTKRSTDDWQKEYDNRKKQRLEEDEKLRSSKVTTNDFSIVPNNKPKTNSVAQAQNTPKPQQTNFNTTSNKFPSLMSNVSSSNYNSPNSFGNQSYSQSRSTYQQNQTNYHGRGSNNFPRSGANTNPISRFGRGVSNASQNNFNSSAFNRGQHRPNNNSYRHPYQHQQRQSFGDQNRGGYGSTGNYSHQRGNRGGYHQNSGFRSSGRY